jgi:hypothetical protein
MFRESEKHLKKTPSISFCIQTNEIGISFQTNILIQIEGRIYSNGDLDSARIYGLNLTY